MESDEVVEESPRQFPYGYVHPSLPWDSTCDNAILVTEDWPIVLLSEGGVCLLITEPA